MKKITLLMLFAVLLLPWAMQAQNVGKDVTRNVTPQFVKTVALLLRAGEGGDGAKRQQEDFSSFHIV